MSRLTDTKQESMQGRCLMHRDVTSLRRGVGAGGTFSTSGSWAQGSTGSQDLLALQHSEGAPMHDHSPIIRAAPPLIVKLANTSVATGEITGYASLFGGEPDSYGDIIAPGAYAASLSELRLRGESPLMLWAHDRAAPIGRWLEVVEDSKGLRVRGQLNLDTTRGKDAHAHIKAGDVSGLSIGYSVPSGGVVFNNDGTQTLKTIDLKEISVVAIPAARTARITGVKSIESQRHLQGLLHDLGLPRAAASKIAAAGWPALNGGDQDQLQLSQLMAEVKASATSIKGLLRK